MGWPLACDMGRGVLVGRVVAAAHVTAAQAQSQVDPPAADPEAVLAAVGGGRDVLDLVQVGARDRASMAPSVRQAYPRAAGRADAATIGRDAAPPTPPRRHVRAPGRTGTRRCRDIPAFDDRPLPERADVVIVGGGYTGTVAALQLARSGRLASRCWNATPWAGAPARATAASSIPASSGAAPRSASATVRSSATGCSRTASMPSSPPSGSYRRRLRLRLPALGPGHPRLVSGPARRPRGRARGVPRRRAARVGRIGAPRSTRSSAPTSIRAASPSRSRA